MKPSHDQTNYSWVNNDAVIRFKHIKHCHSMQQVNEKNRRLQTNELHCNLQIVNLTLTIHTYHSDKNNLTQPALVVTESEWQKKKL